MKLRRALQISWLLVLVVIGTPVPGGRPEFRLVSNAGHYAFLTPCTSELAIRFPLICADRPGFDRVAFHRQLDADVLAFFRKHLLADRPKQDNAARSFA